MSSYWHSMLKKIGMGEEDGRQDEVGAGRRRRSRQKGVEGCPRDEDNALPLDDAAVASGSSSDEAPEERIVEGRPLIRTNPELSKSSAALNILAREFVPIASLAQTMPASRPISRTPSRQTSPQPEGVDPVSRNLAKFCRAMQLPDNQKHQLLAAYQLIKRKVLTVFPDVIVAVFGSVATRLNLPVPFSDLDIVVITPVKEDGSTDLSNLQHLATVLLDPDFMKELNRKLGTAVSSTPNDSSQTCTVKVIVNARVPIIKIQRCLCKIDIGFNTPDVLEARNFFNDSQVRHASMKPLTLYLKHFLCRHNLHGTYEGGIGSFLLQLLVLSHLQMHCTLRPGSSAGDHLVSFFDLYGNSFRYDSYCISVRNGGAYLPKVMRFPASLPRSLCVENPFRPDVDVGMNAFDIGRAREVFRQAHATLVKCPDTPLSQL